MGRDIDLDGACAVQHDVSIRGVLVGGGQSGRERGNGTVNRVTNSLVAQRMCSSTRKEGRGDRKCSRHLLRMTPFRQTEAQREGGGDAVLGLATIV